MAHKSSSFIQLVCDVTGKRQKQPLVDTRSGEWVEASDTDADLSLPAGWGDFRIRVVLENPEIAQVLTRREEERLEKLEAARAILDDPDLPEIEKAVFRNELSSGAADRTLREGLETLHPLPDEATVVLVCTVPVLCDEALRIILKALREANVSIARLALEAGEAS